MESNLNILETKVLEAIKLIKELRAENTRLAGRIEELELTNLEFEELNSKLNHQLDEVQQNAVNVEVYEEKRKEIETKVGGLLEQLEALG
jgi:DNA repair exonuclease SbcCD ATPase subunit